MKKIDILIDRLIYPVIISLLISFSNLYYSNFTEWSNFLIESAVFIFILGGLALIISKNYLINFEIKDGNLNFRYKIIFSETKLYKQLPLNSIESYEFNSASFKKQFHDVTIYYLKENNKLVKFEIRIKDNDSLIEILSTLKKITSANN